MESHGLINAELLAHSHEGEARLVQLDALSDLGFVHGAVTGRDASLLEVDGDGPAVDPISFAQIDHGLAGCVPGDQLLNLIGIEAVQGLAGLRPTNTL